MTNAVEEYETEADYTTGSTVDTRLKILNIIGRPKYDDIWSRSSEDYTGVWGEIFLLLDACFD